MSGSNFSDRGASVMTDKSDPLSFTVHSMPAAALDERRTKHGRLKMMLVLLVCAILTFVATLIVVVCSGTLSLIAFFALYLGESIMFPTIFSLALRDAGTKTKLASSLLIMTIVGGAVAPVIMGYIADTTGSMAIAFLIPLVCYGVIGGYALLKPSASL